MSSSISRYQFSGGQAAKRFSDIEQLAMPLNLTGRPPLVEVELLKSGLKRIFLCSKQDKEIILQFLALGESHAEIHYPSAMGHMKGLNAKFPWGDTMDPAIMFTGLAGTGKTELLKALRRLLGERSAHDLPGHDGVPLVPGWFMTLRNGSGLNNLLLPWLEQPNEFSESNDEKERCKDLKLPRLLELARRVAFRDGVCIMTADEFQFVSKSVNANSMATTLLLQLLSIGPRLIYCANYSLAHRLKARRQEDRQRLLIHQIHLKPESFFGPDGTRLLKEYFETMPEDFKFDAATVAQQLQDYSFGIKRLVVDILGLSWMRAKTSRGWNAVVTTDDFRWAHLSSQFRVNREDVEILQRQEIERKQIREDLWDPFYSEQQGNVLEAKPAIAAFEKRVEEKRLDSFLTPNELSGFRAIQKFAESKPKELKVVPLRGGKRSKQGLADALNLLDD